MYRSHPKDDGLWGVSVDCLGCPGEEGLCKMKQLRPSNDETKTLSTVEDRCTKIRITPKLGREQNQVLN